jgi:hypothetical protein
LSVSLRYRLRHATIAWFPWLFNTVESAKLFIQSFRWRKSGLSFPLPGLIKRAMLLQEVVDFGANTFVETGTHVGDTLWFLRNKLTKLYSIEVHPPLFELSKARFKNDSKVELLLGDSGDLLPKVCKQLQGRVVFWLDGHYSGDGTGRGDGDSPILKELAAIVESCKVPWLVLIDDARLFGTDPAYPSVPQMRRYFVDSQVDVELSVAMDVIRIAPIDSNR